MAIVKAMKARIAVLRDAKRVTILDVHDMFRRFYTKTGGYAQAKKDFYSFEPEPGKISHYSLPGGVRTHIKYQTSQGATFPARLHVRMVEFRSACAHWSKSPCPSEGALDPCYTTVN